MLELSRKRLRVTVRGSVQGVGFRPFIYRLATELELTGWVNNTSKGVAIEVEGSQTQLQTFLLQIEQNKPPRASIQSLESSYLDVVGYPKFEIRVSTGGENTALTLPDIATCKDCLRETFNKCDRRYFYPFTNCTNCGPRFSIITALPYDRANTTMQKFAMCDRCQSEYNNPLDRRFHAQPNACPQCGPHLELWHQNSCLLAFGQHALQQTVEEICRGKIVAIKGLGGFHLVGDARNQETVTRLRQGKHRKAKPFALMYPSIELTKAHCEVSNREAELLLSPQTPIVLLRRKSESYRAIAAAVAPDNPDLGVMLPYTPLHHLLMSQLGFPIVATSGNLTDEPICCDDEAFMRLGNTADVFLIHNRPIARPIDDSVVRVIMEQEFVLRRARGYAPLPILVNLPLKQLPKILAVGAHLKNAIAFSIHQQVFVSQHIGDLTTVAAYQAFKQAIADFQQLYQWQPSAIACDAHPDYFSTQFAQNSGLPIIPVQHHYAHVLSCMAENNLLENTPVLGIAWDGTGYGLDGTIWGGEFLLIKSLHSQTRDLKTPFQRVAHLRTFRLPGGEKAIKEPRRAAIGLLYEILGDALFAMADLAPVQAFSAQELKILQRMLQRNINTAIASSAGRLFDAIASLIGLCQYTQFEGQAAMDLEFAIAATDECYNFELTTTASPLIVDWMPTVQDVLADLNCKLLPRYIAAKFHNTLVEMIVAVAQQIGEQRVVLTGGCFQNKYLIERAIQRLTQAGFHPYWHQQIPTNDGGIALGQIIAAARVI